MNNLTEYEFYLAVFVYVSMTIAFLLASIELIKDKKISDEDTLCDELEELRRSE